MGKSQIKVLKLIFTVQYLLDSKLA